MFSGGDFQVCNLPVFSAVRKELRQECIMYWKQESMENEVSILSTASKGQGFIYSPGAIQLEEKGPFSSGISGNSVEVWIGWPPLTKQ